MKKRGSDDYRFRLGKEGLAISFSHYFSPFRLKCAFLVGNLFFLAITVGYYGTNFRYVGVSLDGTIVGLRTRHKSVDKILHQAGVCLYPSDVVLGQSSSPPYFLQILRGREEFTYREQVVPYSVIIRRTNKLNSKEIIDVQLGRPGLRTAVIKSYYRGEDLYQQEVVAQRVLQQAIPNILLQGTSSQKRTYMLPRRMRVTKTMTMLATAYYPGPECTSPSDDGYTAIGYWATYGIAAVDPRYIRMRTRLYIEGYGYAIAADVGGKIKGNRIDLCFDEYQEALNYGKKRVKVYILR